MQGYRKRQIGTVIISVVSLVIVLCAVELFFIENDQVGVIALVTLLVVLVLLLILFGTLTVDISGGCILVFFGPGLIRKSFPVESVKQAEIVRNRWIYGWGVRRFPNCWIYNVSGLSAVEIELDDGRRYRIGTGEPEELLKAIKAACGLAG